MIHTRMPTLNEWTDADRKGFYISNNLKQKTQSAFIAEMKSQVRPLPRFEECCNLEIKFVEKDRRRDYDNIMFATKFIQDSLVKSGVLKNDSQRYLNPPIFSFDWDKSNPRIEVTVYPAEDIYERKK